MSGEGPEGFPFARLPGRPPPGADGDGPGPGPGEGRAPESGGNGPEGAGESPAPEPGAAGPDGAGEGVAPEGEPGAGDGPPKADPKDFEFRARPEPVTRISRRALAAVAGVGALAMLGVLSMAFSPPERAGPGPGLQGVSISGRMRSEAVERLPQRYSELDPAPPELGPPLPGDFADAILEQGKGLGVDLPPSAPGGAAPYRPNPLLEEEMAERVRAAKLAEQALQSEIFFSSVPGRLDGQGGADAAAGGREPPRGLPAAGPVDSGAGAAGAGEPGPQERREAFLEEAAGRDTVSPHMVEDPLSPWQLMAGTVLRASLVTGVNSDLPGFVIAQVTEDVRDSATGTAVLIPKGARLMGRYDSLVAFGQERILLAWHRIVMPDGSSIVVDNLPAADRAGRAGLAGEVDNHIWELAQGVALSTLLGIGTELSFDEGSEVARAVRESLQGNVSTAASEGVRRGLDIQPTLTAHPGWPLAVIVHRDLLLRPWKGADAEG